MALVTGGTWVRIPPDGAANSTDAFAADIA